MSNKIAHKPVALRDPDVMLYMIDPENNHSKFYEMKIVTKSQETPAKVNKDFSKGYNVAFVLMRRWGRLTDSVNTGRVDSENDTFLSVAEAERAMEELRKQKIRKGYQDVSRTKTYPIGLGGAGFGWGGQAACQYVPELKDLQHELQAMEERSGKFADILQNLRKQGSGLIDEILPVYTRLMADLNKLEGVLTGQLSECGPGTRRSASGCGNPKPGQKLFLEMGRGTLSLMTIPTDPPYCQTYRVTMLSGPSTAVALAYQIASESKDHIEKMEIYDAFKFLNEEIKKRSRRPLSLKWHTWYMPD